MKGIGLLITGKCDQAFHHFATLTIFFHIKFSEHSKFNSESSIKTTVYLSYQMAHLR